MQSVIENLIPSSAPTKGKAIAKVDAGKVDAKADFLNILKAMDNKGPVVASSADKKLLKNKTAVVEKLNTQATQSEVVKTKDSTKEVLKNLLAKDTKTTDTKKTTIKTPTIKTPIIPNENRFGPSMPKKSLLQAENVERLPIENSKHAVEIANKKELVDLNNLRNKANKNYGSYLEGKKDIFQPQSIQPLKSSEKTLSELKLEKKDFSSKTPLSNNDEAMNTLVESSRVPDSATANLPISMGKNTVASSSMKAKALNLDKTNADVINSTEKLIQYIKSNYPIKNNELAVRFNTAETGEIGLKVSQTAGKSIDIQILSESSAGKSFFQSQKSAIIEDLNQAGIQVSDFSIGKSSTGNNTARNEENSFGRNGHPSNSSNPQRNFDEGKDSQREKRQELWDNLKDQQRLAS
jgi:hypothetical protein